MQSDYGDLEPDEVRIDTFTAGMNCTVRVIHIPTGLVATCGEHLGMFRNRRAALKELDEKVTRHRKETQT